MFSVEDVAEPGELDSRGMLAPGSSVCVFSSSPVALGVRVEVEWHDRGGGGQ